MGKSASSRAIALELKRNTKETPSGCWEWIGTLHNVGYPSTNKKYSGSGYGHREMFNAAVCPIPPKMYVLHTCDNRKCINPEHLFLGTHLDNIKDMHGKGRQRGGSLPNEKNPSCKFSNNTVRSIRDDYANGRRKCEIERAYGVSENTYYRIVRNETRKGV